MNSKNTNIIGRVIPPITLLASALAKPKKLNPLGEQHLKYEDQIIFSNYSKRWIELWKVYTHADGFIWLFVRLPLKLIKGRYYLFVADARDPQGIVTFFISKLLRKPIVLSDTFYQWSDSLLAHLIWPFNRFIVFHTTLLSVPSQRVKSFWKSAGIPEKKMRINRTFVSTIEINNKNIALANEIKEMLGYQKLVLFVGRLVKGKGVEYLIKAFAKVLKEVKDVGLLIVGDGPERNRLEALCDDMKLTNVVFTGFINRDEIAPYYLLSDILVLPSIKSKIHEEWGLVVNEAMSVGKPAVVTNSVGCAHELVKNGVNGFIIPEKNVEALCDVVKKLMNDEGLRFRMGKESERIIAEAFTYQHAIEDSKDILNKLLMGIKFH